jgi:hypothetical protein
MATHLPPTDIVPTTETQLALPYSSSVGKLDQAGIPASACTGLYRQKSKINPGDTGSQPKHLHIKRDIKTTNKQEGFKEAIPSWPNKFCFCHKTFGPGKIYGGNFFLTQQVMFLSQTHWDRKYLWREFLPYPTSSKFVTNQLDQDRFMEVIPSLPNKFCFLSQTNGPGMIYGGNSFLTYQILFLSQTHWARKDLLRQFLPRPTTVVLCFK